MTRRGFGRTALLLAGAGLLGRPLAASAAFFTRSKANPNPATLLKTLQSRLTFKLRSAWTRQAARPDLMDPAQPYYRITVHHEGNQANFDKATPEVTRDLRLDQLAHRRRGYGDIGYHFMIDYAGKAWEGRSLAYQGAHVSSRNPGNIGIMLLGNFEIQKPSEAQKAALVKLVAECRKFYGISRRRVYGHRDLDATVCPGRNLYSFLSTLRATTDVPRKA